MRCVVAVKQTALAALGGRDGPIGADAPRGGGADGRHRATPGGRCRAPAHGARGGRRVAGPGPGLHPRLASPPGRSRTSGPRAGRARRLRGRRRHAPGSVAPRRLGTRPGRELGARRQRRPFLRDRPARLPHPARPGALRGAARERRPPPAGGVARRPAGLEARPQRRAGHPRRARRHHALRDRERATARDPSQLGGLGRHRGRLHRGDPLGGRPEAFPAIPGACSTVCASSTASPAAPTGSGAGCSARGRALEIVSRMPEGRLYADGARRVRRFPFGARAVFRIGPEPLRLVSPEEEAPIPA